MARISLDFEPAPPVSPAWGEPTGGNPSARQNIRADPAAFGAPVAKGLETLGQGIERTAQAGFDILQRKEDVAVDQQVNHFIQTRTKLEYGDPSKTIMGPDGQPQQDTGYFGTVGQTALNTRAYALSAMEEARQAGLNNLSSPYAKQRYETETRRMYADSEMRMSRHADEQFKTYTQGVNAAGADANLNNYAAAVVNGHQNEADAAGDRYINAKVKYAQVRFSNDPQVNQAAIADAKRDLLQTRVNAVAVHDPAAALKILDDNRETAGAKYDDIYNHLRSRSNLQLGDQAGMRALQNARGGNFSVPVNDAIRSAAASAGVNPVTMTRFAQIESGGKPDASTGSYHGLFQLSNEEFRKYGPPGGDIYNPRDNAFAAANKMKVEGQVFADKFGHQPTPFDSYMIHQQGLGGYAAHLSRPDAPAWMNMASTAEGQQKGEGWAKKAIWGNIPDQYKAAFGNVNNVTSRDFLNMWQQKFGQGGGAVAALPPPPAGGFTQAGATGPAPQFTFPPEETLFGGQGRGAFEVGAFPVPNVASVIRPTAMQNLLDDPTLRGNPEAFDRAHRVVSVALQTQEIAENENAKAKKELNDKAADEYVTALADAIHTPGSDLVALQGRAAHDDRLNWETKARIMDRIAKYSGEEQRIGYGPGFFDAKQRIMSSPGTAGHIGTVEDILNLPDSAVTLTGQKELVGIFHELKREDQAALQEAKHGAEQAVMLKMVRTQDWPGAPKDLKGEQIFNGKFLPMFNSAYNEWVKAGKNPYEFLLDQKRIEQMMEQVYPRNERNNDRISARGELPPPPAGVAPDAWKTVATSPPAIEGGTMPTDKWISALTKLAADPSPKTMAALDSHLADTGLTAIGILRTLNPAAAIAAEKAGGIAPIEKPTAPAAAMPAATQPTAVQIPSRPAPTTAEGFAERRQETVAAAQQRMREQAAAKAEEERKYNAEVAARGVARTAGVKEKREQAATALRDRKLADLDREERAIRDSMQNAQTALPAVVGKRWLEDIAREREQLKKQ